MQLNLFHHARTRKEEQKRADIHRALLHYEARIGGDIFGPIPEGSRREFFCLDERTWVWHEEWTDTHGKRQVLTTRYDVRPTGVVKSQGSNSYQGLSWQEAQNFLQAVRLYCERMRVELQRFAETA